MQRILFPTEFGPLAEKAEATVLQLAMDWGSELVLLHAINRPGKLTRLLFSREDKSQEAEVENRLTELQESYKASGLKNVKAIISEGKPEEAIVQAIRKTRSEIVVFGTKGGSGLKDAWLGSAVNHVIRNASCPVLTIRNKKQLPGFKRILVLVEDGEKMSQNTKWGIRLASVFQARLYFYGGLGNSPDQNHLLNLRIKEANQLAKEQGIQRIVAFKEQVLHEINESILNYANTIQADLICIMIEKNTIFNASFTDRIVNNSMVSILSCPNL